MALIHIEPVPPRCTPGAVLAFVCDATKLDGKQVGKIAFVGRGATVEVPDAKAAAVVAALDGATFNEKPVRVRFAGKADFTDADHFANLSKLLDLEAKAEQEEARRRRRPKKARPSATAPRSRLVLRDAEFGLGGRLLLTFGRKTLGEPLPPNRLGPGSPVVLNQTNVNRRVPSYRGVVYDRDVSDASASRSTRRTTNCPTKRCGGSTCRRTRCRGCGSRTRCRRGARRDGDRLAELRAVLLGREREPGSLP